MGQPAWVPRLPERATFSGGQFVCYAPKVLKLLTAPVTNDRSPRYMERALAAVHQANRDCQPVTLMYAVTEGRVGLFVQFADAVEELVAGPVIRSILGTSDKTHE